MLERISKLLALAERASTEEEAQSAFAKAQELATRYAIDLEMARLHAAPKEREKPTTRIIRIGEKGKHANASLILLFTTIGSANDVSCLIAHNSTYVQSHGFPSDLDATEALWSSLATTMTKFADRHVRDKNAAWRKEEVYVAGRSYWDTGEYKKITAQGARRSFNEGFIYRISERLREARQASIQEADHFHAEQATSDDLPVPSSMALVLKDKRKEVEDYMWAEDAKRYGKDRRNRAGSWRGGSSSAAYSSSAASAGRAAANSASLNGRRAVSA